MYLFVCKILLQTSFRYTFYTFNISIIVSDDDSDIYKTKRLQQIEKKTKAEIVTLLIYW